MSNPKNKNLRLNYSGFTLIETLISIIASLLIFIVIIAIFFSGSRSFNLVDDKTEIVQNARVTIDRLVRELRQTNEITTTLPETADDPGDPPPSEIEFLNGHTISPIIYIYYYLDGDELKRSTIAYYCSVDPDEYVLKNTDCNGQVTSTTTLEDRIIGEYFSSLKFYGDRLIHIDATLINRGNEFEISTQVYGRNL